MATLTEKQKKAIDDDKLWERVDKQVGELAQNLMKRLGEKDSFIKTPEERRLHEDPKFQRGFLEGYMELADELLRFNWDRNARNLTTEEKERFEKESGRSIITSEGEFMERLAKWRKDFQSLSDEKYHEKVLMEAKDYFVGKYF